jgi:hypothetical protein
MPWSPSGEKLYGKRVVIEVIRGHRGSYGSYGSYGRTTVSQMSATSAGNYDPGIIKSLNSRNLFSYPKNKPKLKFFPC